LSIRKPNNCGGDSCEIWQWGLLLHRAESFQTSGLRM
jgi:hypothetical protein